MGGAGMNEMMIIVKVSAPIGAGNQEGSSRRPVHPSPTPLLSGPHKPDSHLPTWRVFSFVRHKANQQARADTAAGAGIAELRPPGGLPVCRVARLLVGFAKSESGEALPPGRRELLAVGAGFVDRSLFAGRQRFTSFTSGVVHFIAQGELENETGDR
jgi:hypothetical protein